MTWIFTFENLRASKKIRALLRFLFFLLFLWCGGRFQHSILWVDSLYSFAVFLFMFRSGLVFFSHSFTRTWHPIQAHFTQAHSFRVLLTQCHRFFSVFIVITVYVPGFLFYFCWLFRFRWAIFLFRSYFPFCFFVIYSDNLFTM